MKQFSLAALAASFVLVGFFACSPGQPDLCKQNSVRCAETLTCDPTDGACKCGGLGGVVCGDDAVCDVDTNTCASTLCNGQVCRNGQACDPADGTCKCGGPNGEVCPSATVCDPMTQKCVAASSCSDVACRPGETCQPSTGQCVCGSAPCPLGQACAQGNTGELTCVEDKCAGVTCPNERYACDPMDGQCKCGGLGGAECQGGESCSCPPGVTCAAGDYSQFRCVQGSACGEKVCSGGTTCDPADGQCKCGGPGGDVCDTGQLCNLQLGKCQGGDQCKLANGTDKVCGGGTSCDPEDGECKCGGRGGVACRPASSATANDGQVCVIDRDAASCHEPCSPLASACTNGTHCYFNAKIPTPAAYCDVNVASLTETAFCNGPTECYDELKRRPMHCAGLNPEQLQVGRCRSYCDPALPKNQACLQIPSQTCIPIDPVNAPGLGYCQPD